MFGDAGNDTLSGGGGIDSLTDGTGSDTFVFGAGFGSTTVTDYNRGEGDRLDVGLILNAHNFTDISALGSQVGANTVFTVGSDQLTLSNVTTLQPSDFIYNTLVEAFGTTGLDIVHNTYFLYALTGASGPQLSYQGRAVQLGQFAGSTLLGGEKVGAGFEVVWRFGTADQYNLWNVDANGAYQSAGSVINGAAVAAFEGTFQQDLNGDGLIGLPPPVNIETFGNTTLATSASHYILQNGSTGSLTLSYQGNSANVGQFAGWTPIGGEKVGAGFEVVWRFGTADQYNLWNVDANGAYQSAGSVINGAAVAAFEGTFQQDLNGDGTIGGGTSSGIGGSPPPPPPLDGAVVVASPAQPLPGLAVPSSTPTASCRGEASVPLVSTAASGGGGALGASDAAPAPTGGDATAASVALLTNHIASAFPTTATTGPVAGTQLVPVEDFLTKPLA